MNHSEKIFYNLSFSKAQMRVLGVKSFAVFSWIFYLLVPDPGPKHRFQNIQSLFIYQWD